MSARSKLLVGGVLAALLAASVALFVVSSREADSPGRAGGVPVTGSAHDPAHTAPADVRALVVIRGKAEPPPSPPGRTMHGLRLRGRVPASPTIATVMSDEDCAPDARGVSHCLNRLRLDTGRRLTVRHPHAMSQVPCMTPSERVLVVAG